MKKIVVLSLTLLMAICCLVNSVYAISCTMDLKLSKSEISKGEEFTVDIILKEIDAEKGVIALGGTIDYDKNALEYVNVEGQGNWTKPSYNDANGKFALDRNDGYATTEETIARFTFKAKDTLNADDTKITLKEVTSSNGDTDIFATDVATTVKFKETSSGNQGGNNNQGGNGNSVNNSANNSANNNATNSSNDSKNSSTTSRNTNKTISANTSENLKNGVLPNTGATSVVLGIILLVIAVALIIYSRIRVIEKGTYGK